MTDKHGLQPTIACDFDGTLCDHSYPRIGAPKAGAREALHMFRSLGYRVLIYSCRTSSWHFDVFGGDPTLPVMDRPVVKEMIAWLDKHGIEYDEVDDGSRGKPLASLYVDDKGLRFQDNWNQVAAFVYANRPV